MNRPGEILDEVRANLAMFEVLSDDELAELVAGYHAEALELYRQFEDLGIINTWDDNNTVVLGAGNDPALGDYSIDMAVHRVTDGFRQRWDAAPLSITVQLWCAIHSSELPTAKREETLDPDRLNADRLNDRYGFIVAAQYGRAALSEIRDYLRFAQSGVTTPIPDPWTQAVLSVAG